MENGKQLRMIGLKEIKQNDVIDTNAFALTTTRYMDKKTGVERDAKVLILRGTLNDKEEIYLKVNEATTVYKQLEKYLHGNSEDIAIGSKITLEDTFTFDVINSTQNPLNTYQSIRELTMTVDSDTADELFKE